MRINIVHHVTKHYYALGTQNKRDGENKKEILITRCHGKFYKF